MKILLVGEYSRLHNSLKEGLEALGHRVTLVSNNHSFLELPSDYPLNTLSENYRAIRFIKKALLKLKLVNLDKIETAFRFYFFLKKKENYDHIQLISSDAVKTYPFMNRILYRELFRKSVSKSLLISSEDYPVAKFNLREKDFYSVLTPYLENKELKHLFSESLRYTTHNYQKTFEQVLANSGSVITTDFDYETPMKRMGYKTVFIPNPINTDKITYKKNIVEDKIIIFLGISRFTRHKKGIYLFEEALKKISANYSDYTEIIITENVPYETYITLYEKAHIVLDQAYSHDQGYNALTAMAQGKVVFSGAEQDWLQHFNIPENQVVINAKPDANDIYQKLQWLIENPEKITEIGEAARRFIEEQHDYIRISEKYLETWKNAGQK